MNKFKSLILFIFWTNITLNAQQMTKNMPTKYKYESIIGDPIGVKVYTLANGFTIYMSVNKNEPRIFTNIAVKAGSKNDPSETTGLAHYLEHMMFKGTSNIGALNWDTEEKLLREIADLYETHKNETTPENRKAVYDVIDSISNSAAKYVAANEYDKLVGSLGAKATNAYTWHEQTVYVNDIPSNELEKWMKLESERFKEVVLRLFHTELEAVYEEYNINQDRDFRKVMKVMGEELFPNHPYGTQTTIGRGQDLKSPSHYNIYKFFKEYYQINNMAMVISGDFDPDNVVALAEKYFGGYEKVGIPAFTPKPQPAITNIVKKEVTGQEAAYVQFGWRFGGADTKDPMMLELIRGLLYNGQAGIIDLEILQKQRTLEASSWIWPYKDFSAFGLTGKPREGQTLEEVEKILFESIDKLKKGDFPDWLLKAVIMDYQLSMIKSYESNNARVGSMTNAFIQSTPWSYQVNKIEMMKKVTKVEIVDFVKKYMNNNYVVVYKRNGADKNVMKVDKPKITPITLNRKDQSDFATKFFKIPSKSLSPEFVDFKTAIQSAKLKSGVNFDYIKNPNNDLFTLYYVVEMGKNNDKKLPLAVNYLKFLGTKEMTSEQLKQEFYKLGLSMDVFASDDRVYISLSGLKESLEGGIKIMEQVLANVQPNNEALNNQIKDIKETRINAKKDKATILRTAMANFAKYGAENSFTNVLSDSDLEKLKAEELVNIIKSLTTYEHTIFFYGSDESKNVQKLLNKYHIVPKKLKPIIKAKTFAELSTDKKDVFFVNFPMVQAEVILLSKGSPNFNKDEYLMSEVYNNYFGGGLSSIVFQEIRESRALAYSANALFTTPTKKDKAHYMQAYVGTQSDKLKDAITAMTEIIENMPIAEKQIEQARNSVMKKIESERVNPNNLYWNYRANLDKGFDYDIRKDVYEKVKTMTNEDLKQFQLKSIKGRKYDILILGSKDKLDMNYLKTLGNLTELNMNQIFGY